MGTNVDFYGEGNFLWGKMSQVFEGYERQYCELSANLSKKCTSASLLDGGEEKNSTFLHCYRGPFHIFLFFLINYLL